jgi:hypothetical protein
MSLRPRLDPSEGLEVQARALARGSYILSFLRREGLLAENRHLVLGVADTLLKSLKSLKLDP